MASTPRDIRSLDTFYDEVANRPIRQRTVEAIDYKPASKAPETHLGLEGTITLLAARKGSRLMADIRYSLRADPVDTRAVAERLYKQYRGRKPRTLSSAVKTVVRQPVFADVLHGDRVLLEGLFVPGDLEVAFIPLPYNGGELAAGGIVVVEHPIAEDTDSLDILVLRHAPPLTRAEESAIRKVPAHQKAMNVGYTLGPRACSVLLLLAAVVVEAAVVAVTYAITGKVHLEHMAHIRPSELKRMGPSMSARELVKKRRSVLKQKPKKAQKKLHG
jgi:hypothetical protein